MSLLIMIGDAVDAPVPLTWAPGTPGVFESAATTNIYVAALDASNAIVCYRDGGNGLKGTACHLGISGSIVTPGTPVVFEDASTAQISITSLDASNAIVCYRDAGNSNFGTACHLGLSGSTITPGTPVVFSSSSTSYISVAALDASNAIVCYQDSGNGNYGTACHLGLSGSTVTPGTPSVFESDQMIYASVCKITSSTALVCYADITNAYYGTYCVLDISGSTITPGTPGVFESAATYYTSVCLVDATHALVCYSDGGNSFYGTYCLLGISGSIITPGTPGVFESATSYYVNVSALSSIQCMVCYQDNGNSNSGTYCVLEVNAGTVTPGTPGVFESGNTTECVVCVANDSQALTCYKDAGNSNYGTYCLFEAS